MSEKNANKKSVSSPSDSWFDTFRKPLTTAPSRVAGSVANAMDAPRAGSSMFDPNSTLGKGEQMGNNMMAMIRGGLAGATQGVGDIASDMTSPMALSMMALGPMGRLMSKAAPAASAVAKAAPTLDLIEPQAVKQVAPAMDDVGSLIGDMQRNLARVPNSKSITAPSMPPRPMPMAPKPMAPAMPPEMIPRGGEAAFNAGRPSMPMPTQSTQERILDMMANRSRYKQQFGMQ